MSGAPPPKGTRPADHLLLELIREGRHDAEIAVRLGITTGELRSRKAEVRNRIGETQWQIATGAKPPGPRSKRKRYFAYGAAIAASMLVILLVVANIVVEDGEDEELAEVRVVPTATGRPTPAPPVTVEIGGVTYDDSGQFFVRGGTELTGDVALVDNRAALSVVRLKGISYITASEFANWGVIGGGRGQVRLAGEVGGRRIELQIHTETSASRMRVLGSGVGPLAEVRAQFDSMTPTVMLRAISSGGSEIYQTHVTANGRLLVARQPLDSSMVIDNGSGAELDVSNARVIGALRGPISTACLPGSGELSCSVAWTRSNDGFRVPEDGVLTCPNNRTLAYGANGITLEFSLSSSSTFDCPEQPIAAGELIVPVGYWQVRARNGDGQYLSVAVAVDGTIYVGEIRGTTLCPCRPL